MKIYLTSAFSLSMLPEEDCKLYVTILNKEDVEKLIKSLPIEFKIGHQSTAVVLERLLNLNEDIQPDRKPVKLNYGDKVIVFQLLQRPQEGQVYTEKEIQEIINEGKYRFALVEVFEPDYIQKWLEEEEVIQ